MKNSFKHIIWTKSSVDIADSILVALVSKAILILKGPQQEVKQQYLYQCSSI